MSYRERKIVPDGGASERKNLFSIDNLKQYTI